MSEKRKAGDAPTGSKEQPSKKAFTLQQDLVDLAQTMVKSTTNIPGVISDAEAHKLWESALDGPGVTQNEFATLEHILATFKFTDKAHTYLNKLVTLTKTGKSAYKTIKKVRYDRSCLDLAEHLAKDGKLDLADAKLVWAEVEDGPGVTECEKRSVEYVIGKYTLTEGAKTYLDTQLASWVAPVRKTPVQSKKRNRAKKKFTLQIDLVQLAEQFKSTAGVISDAEAHQLWASAMDGPGVTHNEFATLEYILSNYKFTNKARLYLEGLVLEKASGSSFYKIVNKVRYDRSCLDLADHLTKDGKIDLADAKLLWEDVADGNKVTAVEKRTIEYVTTKFTLTEGAKKFLAEQIDAWKGPPSEDEKTPEAPVAAAVAAASPTADAIKTVVDNIWLVYDDDKSGDLDKMEAKNFIQSLLVNMGNTSSYTEDGFEEVFASLDKDGSGTLDKEEMTAFVKKMMPQ